MGHQKPQYEKLLTPAEVGAIFRVDAKTVSRWAKAGKLTSIFTLGGHRRYREAEVRALIGGTPAPDPRFVSVTVAARYILAGDIRNPARHPVALAIGDVIPGTVTVAPGSPVVTFGGGGTITLPEEAARFKRALENGEPVSPVTFTIQIPAGERAA